MKVEVISDDEAAPEDELERELEKAMDQHLASGAPNSLPKPAEDSSALDSLPKPAPNDVAGNSLDEAVAAEKANLAESLPLPDDDARKQQLAMKAAEKEKKEAEKKKQALAKEQKVADKARKEAEKLEKQKLKEEQKKQKEQEKAEKAEEKKRKAEAKKSEAGAKSSKVASQAGSDGGATGSSSMDPAAAPLPSEAPGAEAAEEAAVDQDQEEVADAEDVADAQKSAQKAKRQRKRKAEGDEPKPKGRPRKAESSEAAPAAEPKQKANRTRRGRGQTVDGALVKQIPVYGPVAKPELPEGDPHPAQECPRDECLLDPRSSWHQTPEVWWQEVACVLFSVHLGEDLHHGGQPDAGVEVPWEAAGVWAWVAWERCCWRFLWHFGSQRPESAWLVGSPSEVDQIHRWKIAVFLS